ncbi:MAG: hypothetical protein BWK76_08880 [Desulfobulbaceae bacterium A2]|nr:MAG: hypothetical protein BWK76_08880 [Desulfobulbaceae bacterium A2]
MTNVALALLAVACSLLDRQLSAPACSFETEGGFTERVYRVRTQHRASSTGFPTSASSTKKDSP